MKLRKLFAALALAAAIAAPAAAGDIRIPTRQVDWASKADVAALHQKVVRAAYRLCDSQERPTLDAKRLRELCVKSIVEGTVKTVERPQLAAYHAAMSAEARYAKLDSAAAFAESVK